MPAADDDAAPSERTGARGTADKADEKRKTAKRRRWIWRGSGGLLVLIIVLLVAARLALPSALEWYVNRTLDQHPSYDGKIGDVDVALWRGAYTIEDVRLIKTTGSVPVPLFAAERVDLAIQWDALLEGSAVGRIAMHRPELNFVDDDTASGDQTGAGGPWLEIIQDLFPFNINAAVVHDGSIHFRAFHKDPQVDLYLSDLEASIENLTNIHDEVTPLVTTVEATALAMDHAKLEYQMRLDPFSYRPTFEMAVRLIGLDVTKTNALTRAYGAFDFESGWFDLVVELDAKEGGLEGYVKPMFRNLQVLSLKKDVPEDDVFRVFWEALVGLTTELLENQPRDQFATRIPLEGDLDNPEMDILTIIGNVLRNAFVRAYLPRVEGVTDDGVGEPALQFGPPTLEQPISVGD